MSDKLYGLIGKPLSHSFSEAYFTEKFKNEGLKDCSFRLFTLQDISEFPGLITVHENLKGLAVTIPYKEQVMQYLDSTDGIAAGIQAVNCISFSNGKLTGYNTDAIGFEKSFTPLLQAHHQKALILGTGGAARAVKYVLYKLKIGFLQVSRNKNSDSFCMNYEMLDENIINEYPVIINCTPAGMMPHENEYPAIPYGFLNEKNYLYDLIYNPSETMFLQKGKSKGAIIKNGMEMLVIQAEENWRIWNQY